MAPMRTSGTFITPKYTNYAGKLYYTETGEEITNPDETTLAELEAIRSLADAQLTASDAIQTGDLIRFLDNGLPALDADKYFYIDAFDQLVSIEKSLGDKSSSLYSKNGNKTTSDLFNAPSYQDLHKNSEPSQVTTTSESSP